MTVLKQTRMEHCESYNKYWYYICIRELNPVYVFIQPTLQIKVGDELFLEG